MVAWLSALHALLAPAAADSNEALKLLGGTAVSDMTQVHCGVLSREIKAGNGREHSFVGNFRHRIDLYAEI